MGKMVIYKCNADQEFTKCDLRVRIIMGGPDVYAVNLCDNSLDGCGKCIHRQKMELTVTEEGNNA